MTQEKGFYWQRHAAAEELCVKLLAECRADHTWLARFEQRLQAQTSGRLLDWVDHLLLPPSATARDRLAAVGFAPQPGERQDVFSHPGAQLPRIRLAPLAGGAGRGVALRVDSLADFLQVNDLQVDSEGAPCGPFRRARLGVEGGVELLAVERRGSLAVEPISVDDGHLARYVAALEAWQGRPRGGDEERALAAAEGLATQLAERLGTDLAAHVVCLGERRYWQARNFAGRLQEGRQSTLGLGWGNQDHLTFRSSRRHFARLVGLFSGLGFQFRERFYAGAEAGWGAQLMEQPQAGWTLFLDVDLTPEEVETDFARDALPELEGYGTVGLWCALHGDSVLQAGPHHLAAQFDFDRLVADLARHGVDYMPPFSDFSYLRQAFSVAERWPVAAVRAKHLLDRKAISAEQEETFLADGAIGSHLENIQRREGYKGFNRKNVSAIIRDTDPRRAEAIRR